MKLTTTTCYSFRQGGIEPTLAAIRSAGFQGVDLGLAREGDEWTRDAGDFVRKVRASGLFVGQAHGPIHMARYGDEAYNAERLSLAGLAISVAAEVEAPCIVFHPQPCSTLNREQLRDWNLELFRKLGDKAHTAGTKIALENIWGSPGDPCLSPEEQIAYYDALNDSGRFTCCADLGHFFFMGHDPARAIALLGAERLSVLHVHDNDGNFDQHLMPYFGKMDWPRIMEALQTIRYRGNLNFEVVPLHKILPPADFDAGLHFLAQIGRTMLQTYAE